MFKFNARERELKKITRYDDFTDVMFFRPNLYFHSRKVFFLVKMLHSYISTKQNYDFKKAEVLALMHDDDELLVGDILAQYKINFTKKEKEEYEKKQLNAQKLLVERYGDNFEGFSYRELLEEMNLKTSAESLIVDLADKFDAHCEVCHEILSGNKEFVKSLKGFEGKITNPYDFTFSRVLSRIEKLKTKGILVTDALDFKKSDDFHTISKKFKVETSYGNLYHRISYEPYLLWISSIEKYGSSQDLDELVVQKER